jgi:arginyl-tRNA synthetase
MTHPNSVKNALAERLSPLFGIPADELAAMIARPPKLEMGDYCVGCFQVAKKLGRPPQQAAGEFAERLKSSPRETTGVLASASAIGPYVNLVLDPGWIARTVLAEVSQLGKDFGRTSSGSGKTVVLDYSAPNIAKPFGIGHLRTTVIGNSLKKIHEFLGWRAVGVNHLGDWGTQFGKMIVAFKSWGSDSELSSKGTAHLTEIYVRFHEEAEKNPRLDDEARAWFKKLEDGDPEARALWEKFREISMKEFEKVYALLGVTFDSYAGESFYRDMLDPTVKEIEAKGLTSVSQGALIVDLEKYKMPPLLLKKADEASLYATRDLAAATYRHRTYNFDKLLYVVGAEQKLYFRQLFKALELLGHQWAATCRHVDFGLIRFKGEKMSTRRGKIVLLEDVLNQAIELSRSVMKDRQLELQGKEEIAVTVGVSAIIFADLKNKRIKDVDFDWDKVLSFDGETGPYMQYTHVRLASVLRKYEEADAARRGESTTRPQIAPVDFSLLKDPAELHMMRLMAEFPEVVEDAAEKCEPSLISDYLIGLAGAFHSYYHAQRIITDDAALTKARVLMCVCLKQVIHSGLTLLGIRPLEEM